MFASKTPRDLNRDPQPWVGADNSRKSRYSRFAPRFDPRHEFDHVQHNEPNPILVDFREMQGNAREWLSVIQSEDGDAFLAGTPKELGRVTVDHIVHAMLVLRRLAALEGN